MKIIEKVFDATTNEETIIERDETAAEKKTREARNKFVESLIAESETKNAQRKAIADRLGLTADELQVLLG